MSAAPTTAQAAPHIQRVLAEHETTLPPPLTLGIGLPNRVGRHPAWPWYLMRGQRGAAELSCVQLSCAPRVTGGRPPRAGQIQLEVPLLNQSRARGQLDKLTAGNV